MINAEILREYDIRGIYQKSLKLEDVENIAKKISNIISNINTPKIIICLLYTSPSPRDRTRSRMPSSA